MNTLAGIAERVERERAAVLAAFSQPPLSAIPAPYLRAIVSYLARRGKRLRPVLFLIGYEGYTASPAPNCCRSAVALEFLHDFILIHDDIVDRSRTRRGGPAMHVRLDEELARHPAARFEGRDAAMIIGDMLYAIGLNLFLSVRERPARKARAMDSLTQAAVFTACGELKELLDTLAPAAQATAAGLAQTAEWKTAHYSFVCPLVTGATLAGADNAELEALRQCALALGLAFQIRDDIVDITAGDTALDDLREGRLTLPLWYALRHSAGRDRALLNALLEDGRAHTSRALARAQEIILRSGGCAFAADEMKRQAARGRRLLNALHMARPWRRLLAEYTAELTALPVRSVRPFAKPAPVPGAGKGTRRRVRRAAATRSRGNHGTI
jgi:geranylgeranyl diphosphate synthase type I